MNIIHIRQELTYIFSISRMSGISHTTDIVVGIHSRANPTPSGNIIQNIYNLNSCWIRIVKMSSRVRICMEKILTCITWLKGKTNEFQFCTTRKPYICICHQSAIEVQIKNIKIKKQKSCKYVLYLNILILIPQELTYIYFPVPEGVGLAILHI